VRSPEGPVLYHEDKCMGCRYCMTACPHQVPTYEWNAFNPAVRKCILCAPRLQQGKPCACAAACPTEATTCGERDRLIRTAQARIESHPRRYHPHIYGVEEAGGTSVLFLAPVAFELLGLRTDLPTSPLPDGTATYLEAVPAVASFVVALMGGSWMLFKRRQEVHAVESQAQPEPETEPARSKEA